MRWISIVKFNLAETLLFIALTVAFSRPNSIKMLNNKLPNDIIKVGRSLIQFCHARREQRKKRNSNYCGGLASADNGRSHIQHATQWQREQRSDTITTTNKRQKREDWAELKKNHPNDVCVYVCCVYCVRTMYSSWIASALLLFIFIIQSTRQMVSVVVLCSSIFAREKRTSSR